MNVLSKLLDAAAKNGVFSFHPKCHRIQLTHLCFADDLLIFSKGNLDSIMGIQKVLELFFSYSGLQLNNTKTELFSSGVSWVGLEEMHQNTGFKIGLLPVRYLGVPLVTRRLTKNDCAPLVERITARIKGWAVKFLSFAGRLQLIQSVLFSVYNYWCRNFILPKGVLKRINQLCAAFYWNGNDTAAKGARVRWNDVCRPKNEGGLGLKDIISWNVACILHNIWLLITKAGSLWVAWIEAYILKGRSFWQVSLTQNCSWSWRRLLGLRNLAQGFIEQQNGMDCWKFSRANYKAADVWECIRPRKEKVVWYRLLWTSFVVPKHAVIAWMAIQNRLPTKDRLRSWGLEMDDKCVMCQQEAETRDHIFFDCPFAVAIWKEILRKCGLQRESLGWEGELKWASERLKGKALISILLRVAWNAFVYHIWRERNYRIFQQKNETHLKIMEEIIEVI